MISLGSREARKGLGLGLGFGRGVGRSKMEESELEEGEACSYQNCQHQDYDVNLDPDVALSYIDERIQDVLGHFQKDFEGGVSAENLGAKFGGYGSFLPTYQRSPGWGHPRTPPKAHSQNTPRSPNKLRLEGGQGDTVQFSTGTQSLRLGPGSAISSRVPAVEASSVEDGTQEKYMTTTAAEALTTKYGSPDMKSVSISDQKTLKFRIKMGADNLSTRENAAIYSGLGLDVSTSSSLDDSPSESEGNSREPKDSPFESPTSILQIMTALPVLLSPLADDLIQLTEKEAHARENVSSPHHMNDLEGSGMVPRESNTVKGDKKLSGRKKSKSLEGCESSMEVKGCSKKNSQSDFGVPKEQCKDASITEELVSKTLKVPLLSSSYSSSDNSVKPVDGMCDTSKEAKKFVAREKTFPGHEQKRWVGPTSTEENGFVERTKRSFRDPTPKELVEPTSTEVNGGEKRGVGRKVRDKVSPNDSSVCTENDNPDRDKIGDSIIAEPHESKVRRTSNAQHIEPPKKSKGRRGTMSTERENSKLKFGTSKIPKTKKSSDDSSAPKNETEDVRVQKDLRKSKDKYIDFFGELEEDEDRMDSPVTHYEDKPKETEVIKRSTPATNPGAKERSDHNKVDKPLTYEVYPKTATNVESAGNLRGADADNGNGVPVSVPPVVIEENWVQCDRCHKWRLLPVGTNPDNLPEKWLCNMLYWLPDMNRCSVSEDETTKTLIALYQVPLPDNQRNLQNVSSCVTVGGAIATAHHLDQYEPNYDLHAVPGGKKKIVKEKSNSGNKDGSSKFPSSMKKNLLSSVKSRSSNGMNNSIVSDGDVLVDKHKSKQRMLGHNPDRGGTKNMKVRNWKDIDQGCSRPYKKSKIDYVHSADEEWISEQPEHNGSSRNGDYTLNINFPTTSAGKDHSRLKDRLSSRDSKYNVNDRLPVSVEKTKDQGQGSLDEGSLNMGNYDTNGSVKKRKLKEYQDTHLQEGRVSVHEFSDSRNEKKPRNSKSEGRESGNSKGSGSRTETKGSHAKNQKQRQHPGSTLSQRSLDCMDYLKMDSGSVQVSMVAATSSSSKVSGSHKMKSSFQEVKGSPVESVSSSPMRILNTDKFTNREGMGKDSSCYIAAIGSSQKCSDGEDDGGGGRSTTVRKDKSFTEAHHKSHGSSTLDFQYKGVKHTSDMKSKAQILSSPDIATGHFTNGDLHAIGQDGTSAAKRIKDQCQGEDQLGDYHANVSHPRKIGKGSHLKDNSKICKSESNTEKFKNISSPIQLQDQSPRPAAKQHRDGKVKLHEKLGSKPDKSENIHVGKKDYAGNGSRKNENQLNGDFQEVSIDAFCKQEELPAPNQSQLPDRNTERSSKRSLSERTNQVVGKGKLSLPPTGDVAVDPPKVDDAMKLQKKAIRETDRQNGTQQIGSRPPMLNGHRSKELHAPSPIRRDSNTLTANHALKEAKDLKHLADRLKNSVSSVESTGIYFQAALKFLHGASLLESSNNDNTKHNEMIQSQQVYRSTATLCEFCAHEFEKSKDMATAALAYKCMEVAYLRVIYSSNGSASRDRHELQTALQMVPLGESPSSSASDVDNVNNNSTTADKAALSKCISSPQVAGTHVIAAQNRPSIVRLLSYAQDMNSAMEASRKSRSAFTVACSSPGEGKHAEGISSIKKALDFSFQDVDGLLRLVRLAMEAIAR